ncbi:MAG: hypothetical protein IPN71_03690 [Fibrobacteres bacterium]|nr:hypothetical protein [Fibrobacterota bacterium]
MIPSVFLYLLVCVASFVMREDQGLFLTLPWYAMLWMLMNREQKNGTVISFLVACSFSFYMYQSPFLVYLAENFDETNYVVFPRASDILIQRIVYLLYYAGFTWVAIWSREIKVDVAHLKKKLSDRYVLLMVSIALCWVLMAWPIVRTGGFLHYLLLNKFEMTEMQKLFLFEFKSMALVVFVISMSSSNRILSLVGYFTTVMAILFELMSQKRYLLVAVVFIYLVVKGRMPKLRLATFIYGFGAILGLAALKKMYYHIGLFLFTSAPFDNIFWFSFGDLLRENLLPTECHAHMMLFLNYLGTLHSFGPEQFLHMMASMIPFSGQFIPTYQSAGELYRLSLGGPWTGLASSPYMVPFLCFGFGGLGFVFAFFFGWMKVLSYCAKSGGLLAILVVISLPDFLFYIQREELVILPKRYFLHFGTILLVVVITEAMALVKKRMFDSPSVVTAPASALDATEKESEC